MVANTKIEWATHTFNPWIGCTKVSPACDNCYAETLMDKRLGKVKWGPHGERVLTSDANWNKPIQWDKMAKAAGVRHRVFCASLADWLDNQAPVDWRERLAGLISVTPNLDWLLLTKRIENYKRLSPWSKLPSNVWIGVSAEDQAHYDRRWNILQRIPASVRFISYEPALGPITKLDLAGGLVPDWVIMGGESGPGARPMPPAWARSMRDLCAQEEIPFFFKQWGEYLAGGRVGKTIAGKVLDGVTHQEFPMAGQRIIDEIVARGVGWAIDKICRSDDGTWWGVAGYGCSFTQPMPPFQFQVSGLANSQQVADELNKLIKAKLLEGKWTQISDWRLP